MSHWNLSSYQVVLFKIRIATPEYIIAIGFFALQGENKKSFDSLGAYITTLGDANKTKKMGKGTASTLHVHQYTDDYLNTNSESKTLGRLAYSSFSHHGLIS